MEQEQNTEEDTEHGSKDESHSALVSLKCISSRNFPLQVTEPN